jgi:hypothetical protein
MGGAMKQAWTATVAGRERHDGEKPFTYCLYAESVDAAIESAMTYHALLYEDNDLIMTEIFSGPPQKGVWYAWNDLRDLQDGRSSPRIPENRYAEEWIAYRSLPLSNPSPESI